MDKKYNRPHARKPSFSRFNRNHRKKMAIKKDLPAIPETEKDCFTFFLQKETTLEFTEMLWEKYQEWKQIECAYLPLFMKFTQRYQEMLEQVKERVEAWPNPFVNGRVGEEYNCTITLPDVISIYLFDGLQGTGLEIKKINEAPNTCLVHGIPEKAGDFEIKLVYVYKGYCHRNHPLERNLKITINPDPRSLWKNIATDKSIEYYKEDFASELVTPDVDGAKRMLAASVRGRSHAHSGRPRDDDFALHYCPDSGWYIAAVADGAGSAPFSREGSRIACQTAVKSCKYSIQNSPEFAQIFEQLDFADQDSLEKAKTLAYKIMPQAALEARKAIIAEAESKERQGKDYATTLLLVLCKLFPHGWAIAAFGVGDGAIGLLRESNGKILPTLLNKPDEGEFSGQTRFITMSEIFTDYIDLRERIRIEFVPNFEALLLMSDGVSDAKFETDANLQAPGKWKELWDDLGQYLNAADPQAALLDWLGFWSPGNHDDRTIAIIY